MGDPSDGLREALSDRYRIERQLGRGGMATVYLAQDLRHDRPVALKVLHPELARSLGSERFLREIKLCARLQHPHILTVLHSGAAGQRGSVPELLWFTMPFVEGQSLRDRLEREKQLPIEDAIRIARESADALEYAHRHGVIHRDIKPENILLTGDDHALVADFGIARALSSGAAGQQGNGAETRLTETGITLGTPAYMSPEQAAGARTLDARSDVYSLACVLWEMLAGEPPFTGPTPQAVIARRISESPRPLRAVRETVPESVEKAVAKALSKSPADRYSYALKFSRALVSSEPAVAVPAAASARRARYRSVALVGLGFLLGLGVLFGWLRRNAEEPAPAGARTKRLAVLPFENLGDSTDGYFADGMTDEVRGKLAAFRGLQVIAHRSAADYKGTTKSFQEIGRELDVDFLLVGKVRWEKADSIQSRVRVSPELIEVASSSTRWQEPFDAVLSDVFQVQGEIAGKVAQALDVELGGPERQRIELPPTRDLAAYDSFLKGEESRHAIDPVRAAAAYERAVALDSTFMQAWARLSQAHTANYIGAPNKEAADRSLAAARQAVALAPNGSEGRLALGLYYDEVAGDSEKALEQFTMGRRVAPDNAELLTATALSKQRLGRWENSLDELLRAEALDPRSSFTLSRLARTRLWQRQHAEAAATAERGILLDPTFIPQHQNKVMILLGQGDVTAARAAVRAVPPEVDRTALVSQFASFRELFWVLDDDLQMLLLRLTPAAFDNDRFTWALVKAQTYAHRGESRRARAYADTAVRATGQVGTGTPREAARRVLLGVALAYAGKKKEAIREGERGVSQLPISRDAYTGPYLQHQLIRIYILTGQPQKAVDLLAPLLDIPYYLSPAWLRIDPTFAPLRKLPRFQALIADEGRAP